MTGQYLSSDTCKEVITILIPTIARLFSIQRGLDWGGPILNVFQWAFHVIFSQGPFRSWFQNSSYPVMESLTRIR